jgi:hypothetical protein
MQGDEVFMPLDYVLPLLNNALPTAKEESRPALPYLVPSLEDLQELEGSVRLHLGEGSDERLNEGLVAATESRVGRAITKIRIIRPKKNTFMRRTVT